MVNRSILPEVARLLGCVLLCEVLGSIGTIFTSPNIPTWYAGLQKPTFTPPSWVFGPAWTLLFVLLGVGLYLVWREARRGRPARLALGVFLAQFLLNILWSLLFFGLRSPLAGLLDIIPLWIAILATILVWWRLSRPAALVLVPYLLWVSFATALNTAIWHLNG